MLLGNLKFASYSLAACRIKSFSVFFLSRDGFVVVHTVHFYYLFIFFYSATSRPLHLGSFKITLAFL